MKQALERLRVNARGMLQGRPAATAPSSLGILALLTEPSDCNLLQVAATTNRWQVTFAGSEPELTTLLARAPAPVALCDRDLLAPHWGAAVQKLAACSPRTCILLVTKVADFYLWDEIVWRGGYDLVSKPLQPGELVRAVKSAWSYSINGTRIPSFTK
jgi:DNA-binding NtrC family response regulator